MTPRDDATERDCAEKQTVDSFCHGRPGMDPSGAISMPPEQALRDRRSLSPLLDASPEPPVAGTEY